MNYNARMLAEVGVFFAILFCNISAREVYALAESTGPGGSNAIAVHQLGQTGEGVNVGVIAARSIRTTHEAFRDDTNNPHAFNFDFTGDGNFIDWHDTQLAGVISSRGGVAHPNDIGVAPRADVYCARIVNDVNTILWTYLNNALADFIVNRGCRVIVTGIQLTNNPADGQSSWTMLYDYYAYENNVIFTNAAGNLYPAITIFGDAYNGITTGGLRLTDLTNPYDYRMVGSVSNSGPTTDGRRKPDITAPSQGQTTPTSSSDTTWTISGTTGGETSYSAPQAAGAAALLLGLADDTPGPNDNKSEVIKAVMVNSAMPNVKNKTGASTNPADSNNTWQKDRGYGRLDVLRAYQTLDTNEVEPETYIEQDKGWGFGRLEQSQTDTYTISVTTRCRLIATLSWHRRVTKNGSTFNAYLANLDMTVYGPDGTSVIFNKSTFGFGPKDNLVKCDLLILEPGDYTIEIANNSATDETANYGLAFELHPVIDGDLPPIDYTVDYFDLSTLAAEWLSEDSPLDELLSPNSVIDFGDFAILANTWLQIDPLYYQF